MPSKIPSGSTPNEQGNGYEINEKEAEQVRSLFEQTATKPESTTSQPQRAAIYAYSAISQNISNPEYGVRAQIQIGQAHCTTHGYTLEEKHIYQTSDISHLEIEDPSLTAILQAACNKEIDVLVILDYARISRKQLQREAYITELAKIGVRVECADPYHSDITELVETITRAIVIRQREQLAKRRQSGKAAKKAQREQQH